MNSPCDMTLAYYGDSWQDHRERDGYLAKGWEPGLDIIARAGKPDLFSILPGKVIRDKDNGYNDGFGVYCDIDHGVIDGHRYRSLHAHMDGNIVRVGQVVKAGEKIGVMGTSGNSSCIHDHFILWVDGVNVDPMPYLAGAPIVTPPPVEPPAPLGSLVKIATPYTAVGLRTKPVEDGNVLLRRLASKDGYVFEPLDEVFQGRQWTRVIVYIASEFLEAA
jgi:hypothetical protein